MDSPGCTADACGRATKTHPIVTGSLNRQSALYDINGELAELGTVIRAEEHDKIRAFALDS